jgi:hypothetical protein
MLPENVRARLSCRRVPGILYLLAATDQRWMEAVCSMPPPAERLAAPPVALMPKPLEHARSSP